MNDSGANQGYRNWKGWGAEDFGCFDAAEAAYFAAELKKAGIVRLDAMRVLEIGFGNGRFAGWVSSEGASYRGTELDDTSLRIARERGFEVFQATVDLTEMWQGKPFDFIFAFDVLEHLDLRQIGMILRSAGECLAPAGRILVRFPSGDSPFSRAVQYGDATHRTVIGSGIIEQLARDAGLEVVQLRAPAFPLLGLGPRRFARRLPVAILRAVVSLVINLAFNDNLPRVMTPNMVVVMRRRTRDVAGNP